LQTENELSSARKFDKIMKMVQDNMKAIQAKTNNRSRSEGVNASKKARKEA